MPIDISQFHQTFFEESFEGIEAMETGLLEIDAGSSDDETINTIFRAAHSIKGGSATFGFTDVASFTHVMETLLDEVRDGKRTVTNELTDVLLRSVDFLKELLATQQSGGETDKIKYDTLLSELNNILGTENTENSDTPPNSGESNSPKNTNGPKTWNISFAPYPNMLITGNDAGLLLKELSSFGDATIISNCEKIPGINSIEPESCYLSWDIVLTTDESEETIRAVFDWVDDECDLTVSCETIETETSQATDETGSAVKTAEDKQEKAAPATPQRKAATPENSSIRVGIDKVDALVNMVGELVITQSMMGNLDGQIDDFTPERLEQLREGLTLLERNTRELQESVMRIRMLPISFAFNRFPRMVHDLCNKLDKKIDLNISGEQTELDKTVMEKIGDPLVHIVRNSIDHGIEMPATRVANGKPETGTIFLNSFHQGGNVVIEIKDDGAGVNKVKIREKAIAKGLISEDEVIPDEKIAEILFLPGFSTADEVSDLSGRGVGMDVVRRNIKELGGTIEMTSIEGQGTTIIIRLPLTLAILDGQLLTVADHNYIIPLVSIVESLQMKKNAINTISGSTEVYKLREDYIPILRLGNTFKLKTKNHELEDGLLVVIEGEGRKIGIFVDDLLGQQQVVIKSLDTNYRRVKGISGATILGDGKVALILDVAGLISLSNKKVDAQAAA